MKRSFPLLFSELFAMVLGVCLIGVPGPTALAQQFENVAPAMGIVISPNSFGHAVGGGVSWFDPDQDGALDVLASTVTVPPILYRQKSGGFIMDEDSVLPDTPPGTAPGHLIVDFDSDGDDDILLLREGKNVLLRNDAGVFLDVSATHLPGKSVWGASAAPGDVDGDGDVDILIANYIKHISFPRHLCAENQLLINDGHGRFVDKALEWNVGGDGCSLAAAMTDYDNDGDLDLMVVNDFGQFTQSNELYRNDGPLGSDGWQFTDVSAQSGWEHPMYAMGIAVSDVNDDGWLDYFVTNIGRPMLVTGGPDGFTDVSEEYGMGITFSHLGYQVTWGAVLEDLDGDGWVDLFAAGGHVPATSFIGNAKIQRNVLIAGGPTLPWNEMPAPWSIPTIEGNMARGVSLGDYNKDGHVDMALLDVTGMISIYKNQSDKPLPLRIRLHAQETHYNATGTRITATCGSTTRVRELTGGTSFAGTHEPVVRVTFPDACNTTGQAVDLQIRWPSGHVQALATTTGADMSIKEPNWLEIANDTLSISPTNSEGAPLAADATIDVHVAGGATLKTVYAGDHTWQTDLAGVSDALLSIDINNVTLPVHPRIHPPAPSMFGIHTWPQALVKGQEFKLVAVLHPSAVKPAQSASITATLIQDGTSKTVELVSDPTEPGVYTANVTDATVTTALLSIQLAVNQALVDEAVAFPVHPRVSSENSNIEFRNRYLIGTPPFDDMVRVELILRDINSQFSQVGIADVTMMMNEIPIEPIVQMGEISELLLAYDSNKIPNNATLQLWVDDTPVGDPRIIVHLSSEPDVAQYIDPSRSMCSSTIETIIADGQDTATHMLFLRDAVGDILLVPTFQPTFNTTLVSIVPGSYEVYDERLRYRIRAGTQAGIATVTPVFYGMPLDIPCTTRLLPAQTTSKPLSATNSAMSAMPTTLAADGESKTTLEILPRLKNERLYGSGLLFDIQTTLGEIGESVSYAGVGAYTSTLVAPKTPGDAIVTAQSTDPDLTVSTIVPCFDPAVGPPVDGGTVEETEPVEGIAEPTEAVESTESVETVADTVESVEDVPDTVNEDALEDVQTSDTTPNEIVEAPAIDVSEPSIDTASPDPSPPDSPPADTTQMDVTSPEKTPDTVTAPETHPSPTTGGGGCAHTAGPSSPWMFLVTTLVMTLLLRTRRRICDHPEGGDL